MIVLPSVYLAGSWNDRPRLRAIRARLESLGVTVTSRWLDAPEDGPLDAWAGRDLEDIDAAHTMLLFTDVPSTAGGMHFEAGYALGCGMTIIGVGPKTMLFHHVIDEWFPTEDELCTAIAEDVLECGEAASATNTDGSPDPRPSLSRSVG